MKVLLTGGGGFLGAWIVKRLMHSGLEVRIFDASGDRRLMRSIVGQEQLEWIVGDIVETEQVIAAAKGCQTIIHLAGVQTPFCMQNPLQGARINVLGTLNVFEAAKIHGIPRLVYTSSGGVFGLVDDENPEPITHYGAYKLANEGSARAYWHENGISSIGLRPFVVYGPGREVGLTATLTQACRAAAIGEPYVINLSGTVPLVFVDDVAAAYEAAAGRQFTGAHTVNLPGTSTNVGRLIEIIKQVVPGADIASEGSRLPSISTVQNQHDSDLLGLPPETSVEEGVRRTIEFYRTSRR